MVCLDIQDNGDGRVKGEEGIIVFAGFHNNSVAVSDPVSGVEERQRSAYHDRRILFSRHHNVRTHGGRGRLAVCAGDAQGVCIVLGYRAPCLSALENGNTLAARGDDFGVVVMDSGGSDDKFNIVGYVFGLVANLNVYSVFSQRAHVMSVVHVGAGDGDSHTVKHLRERGHGHSAYTDEVASSARRKKIVKLYHGKLHSYSLCLCRMRPMRKRKRKNVPNVSLDVRRKKC